MTHKPTPVRPARDGETCSCGKPATKVWLTEDFGPVHFCGTPHSGQRRADCPPWCVVEHSLPFDREHGGEVYGVELDAHPYQVRVTSGEWETWRHSVLTSITQPRADRAPYIALIGQDENSFSHLTADEADQLADILHNLAATLRHSA